MSTKFNNIIKRYSNYLSETSMAGAGGVFGTAGSMGHGGAFGNQDFYATGDARNIFGGMTAKKKRKKKGKKGKGKKGRKKMKSGVLMPLQRRKPFSI